MIKDKTIISNIGSELVSILEVTDSISTQHPEKVNQKYSGYDKCAKSDTLRGYIQIERSNVGVGVGSIVKYRKRLEGLPSGKVWTGYIISWSIQRTGCCFGVLVSQPGYGEVDFSAL